MPRPFEIRRSLYRSVIWMGMERIPGALWVLCFGMLCLMGFMYAKAYIITACLVVVGAIGTIGLRKLAEYDADLFKVLNRRKSYQDNYPAHPSTLGWRDG